MTIPFFVKALLSNPRNVLSLPLPVSVIQGLLHQRVPDVLIWKEKLPDVAEKEKQERK